MSFIFSKLLKRTRHLRNLKLQCPHDFTTSLSINLRKLVELCMICHLDFTLYLWGVHQKTQTNKLEGSSIPYKSSGETVLVKWYRNLMFTYYNIILSFSLQNIKKVSYTLVHSFKQLLCYQKQSKLTLPVLGFKEFILK